MSLVRKSLASALCVLMICFATACPAAVTFTIDDDSFISDGVNPTTGIVDVYVTADGGDIGDQVAGWNAFVNAANLTGTISGVTFSAISEPVSHVDLFPGSAVVPQTVGVTAGGSSNFSDTSNPALFDDAGLMSFQFSVATGQTGSFDLVFNEIPTGMSRGGGGGSFAEAFSPGSITISAVAVPEPSSLLALSLLGVGLGGQASRKRLKKAKLVAC
ncbi:PEP-CTERM sorting domain-containing protein [Rhodopirellula baltica]|uniref:PEP-CTERM sorting domain-containing protein n=1 Tax=Rhodopirellula baltica TaxID=265606 RepID=UPI00056AD720|nr:PEP-CTERM sorting domain-containing protein [Rhodopirellula baltica]